MDANKVFAKIAEYIEIVQPQLDEYNEFKEEVIKKAHEIGGALEAIGVIPSEKKADYVQALIDDPLKMGDTVIKLASDFDKSASISQPIGTSVDLPSGEKLDALERWALYGDPDVSSEFANNVIY